ncbi:MAG: type II secretion system ATPase GspE [Proteobacteria bacterium]|nr:type II secretion system ATPase GspE [Pseudomonadota bacterium]
MNEADSISSTNSSATADTDLNSDDVAQAGLTASERGTDTSSLNSVEDWLGILSSDTVSILPYSFAKRHNVVTLFSDDAGVHLLCIERPPFEIYAELKRRIKAPMLFHKLAESEFESVLRQSYEKGQSMATQMVDDISDEIDLSLLASEIQTSTDLLEAADDAPVVKLINTLLTQAIRENASDIHLEVFEKRSLVRFRSDGVLKDVVEPRRELHGALVSRLKVMAGLDIAEKRLPQDGRISLHIGNRPVDVRVSCLPTQYGERVVLRLLDKHGARLTLDNLGMSAQIKKGFDEMIKSPHGILLVTGPTGSGKTTTLYAGLGEMDRQKSNILTVEDPIEYDLDGVGQIQVRPKIGLTFARGLRSILRQDPDVVLIGEIRDIETAEIAIQASLTGHLVLSTLHTNTAIGAMTRLIDMGVEPFLIASSLLGVMSQRLVRTLCGHCKEAVSPDELEAGQLGLSNTDAITIYAPVGCKHCDQTGFRGRKGIYELITIDEAVRKMIHDSESEDVMINYVRRSTPSLFQNGVELVLSGETSLSEIIRVTRDQ